MAAAAVKLSPALKALIAAPHALGAAVPAPSRAACTSLFDRVKAAGQVGNDTFLTASAAALCTVNSPATLVELYKYAGEGRDVQDQVRAAALIREVALKCIAFNGVSRF